MREFFRVIERVERGREFEPTVGKIREEDIWERKGEKESEENADGEETQVVFFYFRLTRRECAVLKEEKNCICTV